MVLRMAYLLTMLIMLATYRVTRLITRDKLPLIALPRDKFVERWGVYEDEPDKTIPIGVRDRIQDGRRTNLFMRSLAYLWECDWCMSIWVGALVVYAVNYYVGVPLPVLQWLAASAVTGILAQQETVRDREAK